MSHISVFPDAIHPVKSHWVSSCYSRNTRIWTLERFQLQPPFPPPMSYTSASAQVSPAQMLRSFLLKAVPLAPEVGGKNAPVTISHKTFVQEPPFICESFPPSQNISKKVSSDDKERKHSRRQKSDLGLSHLPLCDA